MKQCGKESRPQRKPAILAQGIIAADAHDLVRLPLLILIADHARTILRAGNRYLIVRHRSMKLAFGRDPE